MAIFRVLTFFIHAMVAAMASMLAAVFTHIVPAVIALVVVLALIAVFCTTCGFSGLAFWKRKAGE